MGTNLRRLMALCLTAAALTAGCSGNPPQLLKVRFTVTLFDDREKGLVYEYLSIGFQGEDEDGQDDLEALSVIHDEDELYWRIPREKWSKRVIKQETWFVVDALAAADLSSLPRGTYRLVLTDYSGARAETSLTVDPPKPPDTPFPSLRAEKNALFLVSAKGEASLLIRSSARTFLGSFTLKSGTNAAAPILQNQQIKNQAKHLFLHEYGEGELVRVSGPYEALEFLFPR